MATPIKQIKDSANILHDIQGIEYIVGTQTANTNMWKGVSDSEELYAGKVISYKLPYAGSTNTNTHTGLTTNTTLELTLANGTTVVYPVYRNASTSITTQYPQYSIVRLVFDPTSVTLNGHTFAGSWKTADYDSNTNTYVTQSSTTTNGNLPLILKATTSTGTVTTSVRFNSKLTGNPSVGSIKLNTTNISPTASSAITLNLPSTDGTIALEGFVTDSITTAISGVTQFDYAVTSTLPTTGVKGTIYLTPHTHGVNDIYDEYIYANNDWEKIGNTDINLDDYATTTYVENAISAVSTNYQKAPLIGNTNNTTPSQVAVALAEGKDVFIETTQNFLGFNETFLFKVTVYGKTVSNLVVGSGLFKYSGHIYALKLEGFTQTDTWSWDVTEVALASDIPTITATTTTAVTGVGSNGTTTALTSVVATTTSIYPAANVTALTSVTRSTTSIYPAANITAITTVTGTTTTMYGTGTVSNIMSAPTVIDGVLQWTLVSAANGTSATVVTGISSSGKSVRGAAATVVNAVTIAAGTSVRDAVATVATGALTTKTATVLTGVKATGTTVVISGITST